MSTRLSECTTFRLGGPCRRLVDCARPAELVDALRDEGPDALLIGGGSNLLVADEGVDRVVIRYAAAVPEARMVGEVLEVAASAPLDAVAALAGDAGLEGLVCCSGIPGTVGGAIAGNAGAFGEQIGDVLESVQLVDRGGRIRTVGAHELDFGYRRSGIQCGGEIVLTAHLHLRRGDAAALGARRAEILALRAAKHPDWRVIGTAGSFFKNIEPTSRAGRRQAAGWFLEQAGALQMRVGGAHTFERHANILVADPGARSADVLALSLQMAAAVRAQFGLALEREVRLVGFDASTPVS